MGASKRRLREQQQREAFEAAISDLERIAFDAAFVAGQMKRGKDQRRVLNIVEDLQELAAFMGNHLRRFEPDAAGHFLAAGSKFTHVLVFVLGNFIGGPINDAGSATVHEAWHRIQGASAALDSCVHRFDSLAAAPRAGSTVGSVTSAPQVKTVSARSTVNDPSVRSMGAAVPDYNPSSPIERNPPSQSELQPPQAGGTGSPADADAVYRGATPPSRPRILTGPRPDPALLDAKGNPMGLGRGRLG